MLSLLFSSLVANSNNEMRVVNEVLILGIPSYYPIYLAKEFYFSDFRGYVN